MSASSIEKKTERPTERQIELMSHALGADSFYKHKGFYRNRFAASKGSEDFDHWVTLEETGYAERNEQAAALNSSMVFFHCTEKADKLIRDVLREKKHESLLTNSGQ